MTARLRSVVVVSLVAFLVGCGAPEKEPSISTVVSSAQKPAAARQAVPASCDALTPPPEAQFPPGFDYPQQASTIGGWVTPGGGSRMRYHAYCVFAGLNYTSSSGGPPTWQTWGTSTQAFPNQYNPWQPSASSSLDAAATQRPVTLNSKNASNATVGGVGAINNPAPIYGVNPAIVANPAYKSCLAPIAGTSPQLYALKDGNFYQSNGDIMVANVSYNEAALAAILKGNLFDAASLDSQLPPGAKDPATTIRPLPPSSIVLKVMHWPVSGGGSTWSEVTALPVWDWDAHKPGSAADGQYAGYEIQKLWTDAVAISSGPPGGATGQGPQRVQYLYGVLDASGSPLGPLTYDAPVVGVERFYNHRFSESDLASLSPCDRAILDASAYWAYNRAFKAGDYLVMVAMHIMTKEQSDWTFQSAWWHPDAQACTSPSPANQNRFCNHRPASVPGGDTTYLNYMMTTTYGTTQNQGQENYYSPPGTQGALWPVAYNPYIELAASHPITTNCMNCHHRAAWPPDTPGTKPDRGRSSSYLQDNPPNPNALEVFEPSNGVFAGLLLVDSMWAVSDRAGYPATASPPAPQSP